MVTSLPCRVLAVSLVAQLATALVAPQQRHRQLHHRSGRRLSLDVRMAGLSPLPGGISPYAKALKADVQGEIRSTSFGALQRATADGVQLAELEWPPLLGGAKGKSQLDDFTNIDVLDANRDNAMQLGAALADGLLDDASRLWIQFADAKELELAREAWPGGKFQRATLTTIQAATKALGGDEGDEENLGLFGMGSVLTSLGSLFSPPEPENPLESGAGGAGGGDASGADGAGGAGVKGAEAALPVTQLVVQPGDGGPMEDWMGLEALQVNDETTIVILNGALDKLRMGYYSPFIFPKLNKVVDRFYRKFETVYYLKPILDKGCYGWLYRVYPEPWQVCFQTSAEDGAYVVVSESQERPDFRAATAMVVQEGGRRVQEARAAAEKSKEA